MTKAEVTKLITEALASAPATTPKAVKHALIEAGQFIDDLPESDSGLALSPESVSATAPAIPECIAKLETALAMKAGVMDSDSRRDAIEQKRLSIVNEVVERLRAA